MSSYKSNTKSNFLSKGNIAAFTKTSSCFLIPISINTNQMEIQMEKFLLMLQKYHCSQFPSYILLLTYICISFNICDIKDEC